MGTILGNDEWWKKAKLTGITLIKTDFADFWYNGQEVRKMKIKRIPPKFIIAFTAPIFYWKAYSDLIL